MRPVTRVRRPRLSIEKNNDVLTVIHDMAKTERARIELRLKRVSDPNPGMLGFNHAGYPTKSLNASFFAVFAEPSPVDVLQLT